MGYLVLKAVISGVIVAAVSEIAKRSPALGALVVSLPLVSILAMIWLWRDTADPERIAGHAQATFWFVLPSLPISWSCRSCCAWERASGSPWPRHAGSRSGCTF